MKKRVLAAIMILLFIPTILVGCTQKGEGQTRVSLSTTDKRLVAVEEIGALATNAYIYARLKTEALGETEFKTPEEAKSAISEVEKAWENTEKLSNATIEAAKIIENITTSQEAKMLAANSNSMNPFNTTIVEAATTNVSKQWAEDITKKFDSYPAGQKIKKLAEDLNVDAKEAYKYVQAAQEVVYNEQMDEARYNEIVEKTLIGVKASCKVGLFVTGLVATGGLTTSGLVVNSTMEGAGLLINGADTLVSVGSAASNILLGENDTVTATFDKISEFTSPASSIFSLGGLATGGKLIFSGQTKDVAETIDKLNYVAESIIDYVNDGNILGGIINVKDENKVEIKTFEVTTDGKTKEEITKELKENKVSLPEEKEKTITELVKTQEEKVVKTDDIDGIITIVNEIVDNKISQEVKEDTTKEETKKEEKKENKKVAKDKTKSKIKGKHVPLEKIKGSYTIDQIDLDKGGNIEGKDGIFIITDDVLAQFDDYTYDEKSGKFTASLINEAIEQKYELQFSEKSGNIYVSGTVFIKNPENGRSITSKVEGPKKVN